MSYYRKIVGERLYLSPVSANEEDAGKYLKWMNDKAVAGYFGQHNRIVASKSDLKWLYETPADMQRYAMVLLEGDKLLGSISIHNIDHLNRCAFIGIFIGEEERRGKGYGAEAIRLLLRYGFYALNLHSILLTVHADNLGGIACYKKVGFREVGRLPEQFYTDGAYVDKLYMCVLEREFEGWRV
jgi:RimJ/RimL family protein N-acetyltransferase